MDSIPETKMNPEEKLFVQIFERKKSIILQVKHQTDLFDHHLASKCLLDGITPPPWLFPSHVSLPKELKKEDILSGLLLPRANPYSSSQFSLKAAPVVSANNVELPSDLYTEVCGEKVSASVDRLSILPQFCADGDGQRGLDGALEGDFSVTSPQDCGCGVVLDYGGADHGQSLARIQRSKSRQRALELRNSAKGAKMCPHDENDRSLCSRQIMGSGISSLHFDHADDSEVGKAVGATIERCVEVEQEKGECRGNEDYSDIFSGRVVRSTSSTQLIRLVSEPCNAGMSSYISKEDGRAGSFGSIMQRPNHAHEVLAKPSVIADVNCAAEKANTGDFKGKKVATSVMLELDRPSLVVSGKIQAAKEAKGGDEWSKEKGSGPYLGRITRSRSSTRHPNHKNGYLNLDSSDGNAKEEKMGECRDKEDCSGFYCGRSKWSESSSEQIRLVNGPMSEGMSLYNGKEGVHTESFGRLIEQPNPVHNLSEIAKHCSVIADVNCAAESNAGDFKGNTMATGIDSGRIMRIGSSSSSSENSQPLSLAGRQGFGLHNELATQINALPCTESDNIADLERCDAVVADTDIHVDALVVVSSGSMPPNECAMQVKPKLLDFDVEECSLNETSDPVCENKQPCISQERSPSTLLHSTDTLDTIVSIDHQEDPDSFSEIPLMEVQEDSSKDKKPWNNSSEDFVKSCLVLVDENATESLRKKTATSQNQHADTYPMGLRPWHEPAKMGSELNALSASPIMMKDQFQPFHADNVELSLEGRDRCANIACSLMNEQLGAHSGSSFPGAVSQGCLSEKAQVADSTSITFGAIGQDIPNENKVLLRLGGGFDLGSSELLIPTEKTMRENKSHAGTNGNLSHCSVGSSLHEKSMDLTEAGQSTPEFRGFVIDADEQPHVGGVGIDFDMLDLPTSALERASFVERLCKSACVLKSLSHYSSTYKSHRTPNLYRSIPNGLLEGMVLSTLNVNGDSGKQLEASSNCMNEEASSEYGRYYSECLPFSNVLSAWDIKKPYLSPAGKFWAGITSSSGSSEKRASSIPDLPCITEENENIDEVADTFQDGIGSEVVISTVKREPLADISENLHPPPSVYEAERLDDRCSVGSVNTEFSFTGTCKRAKLRHGKQNSNKRRYERTAKENQSMSLEVNGVKKANQSLLNRFSKPKLSGKTGLRKGGPSMSERDCQHNNIVSNITSFIPLVQQKQAAEVIIGKRDIKVKAIEAAEAAKRLAEKKENERKMKKEALKHERARMEEENLRQLELEKEKKEEERKRKVADMAAKKRQREEDERKERERKRKRVEEARRLQLENKAKLRAEKEQKDVKYKAAELKEKSGKHEKMEKATEWSNLQKEPETDLATAQVSTTDTRKSGVIPEARQPLGDHCETFQEVSYLCKAMESDKLTSNICQEQSYEISPYKVSDDEDEDEDEDDDNDMSNTKFVPSWASKKNVSLILSSQQRIDPESIFSPESFCDIAEVLLPIKLHKK